MDCALAKVASMPWSPFTSLSTAWSSASVVKTASPRQASATLKAGPGSPLDHFLVLARRPIVVVTLCPALTRFTRHTAAHVPEPDEADVLLLLNVTKAAHSPRPGRAGSM